MGKPPDGKGGKKGGPPPPKSGDGSLPQGKGKGPPKSSVVGGLPMGKPDMGMIWYSYARKQCDDGHWDGDFLVNLTSPPLFTTQEEKDVFGADCPFLSTLVMMRLGEKQTSMFHHDTKQVREIKMGDGREHADEVVLKKVELTDEEKEQARVGMEELRERTGMKSNFLELAEQFLSGHPLSDQRAIFEERAQAVLSLFKVFKSGSERQAARPRANTDEKNKREEERAKKEAERRQKEQDALAARVARLKHIRSLRPADINNIQWSKAKELHFVEGGSGGVMLVDLEDSCVVLKQQGKTAGNEMMAEHVADAIGVPVAHVRVVKGDECREIGASGRRCQMHNIDAVMGLGKFFGIWSQDESEYVRYTPLLGILEFAPGHSLMGMDGKHTMQSASPELLEELGRLCALDVLINNLDRVPLPVWQNEGNLGNVMIVNEGHSVLGIDQQVNLIIEGPGRDKYAEKVRTCVENAKPGGDSKEIVAKLRKALLENCGFELPVEHVGFIVAGLQKGFQAISEAYRNGSIKRCLEEGEKKCFESLISEFGDQPNLDILSEMCAFVDFVASQISDQVDSSAAEKLS